MKREISHGLSVYLDFVRLGAAFVVVMSHVWSLVFPKLPLPWPGHSAVVVFFVLSGFVISHAARPELGLSRYIEHRIARIYPVALAAALLAVVITGMGISGLPNAQPQGEQWRNIALNMLFLGQSWADLPLPFNAPFWSLNYEIWYYVIFGIWCYLRKPLVLLCAVLIAGPKILLLMPVWLMGVLLHRWMMPLERSRALQLFAISLIAGLVFFWLDAGVRIRHVMQFWWPNMINMARGSNQFVGDWLLGLIVTLNFLAAGSLGMGLLLKFEKGIRYLSGFTFSIYLLHMPLTVLIWNGFGIHSAFPFFALLLTGVFILASVTERRVKWYRSFFSRYRKEQPWAVVESLAAHAAQNK